MKKKGIKSIYIIETILLIYIGIFKIIFFDRLPEHQNIANIIFWLLFSLGLFLFYGYFKDRNYLKKSTIKVIIIITLIYFLTTYLFGFFVGFIPSSSHTNILDMLKNILIFGFIYTAMEFSKHIILRKKPNKIQIVILTLEYIVLNVLIIINGVYLGSYKNIFIATTTLILPTIASEIVYTYITYKINYVPSLIQKLSLNLYIYIVPFLPSLGNYITSVVEVLVPFITYLEIRKILIYKDKYALQGKKTLKKTLTIILVTFLLILVSLTSGLFKHELIAIISGSMSPVYDRGDAVIITKKDPSDIKIGEVLAFNTSSGIVTHRVINISSINGVYTFVTKGDANTTKDTYEIHNENVIGTVDYVIKYAGFPTVWLTELFERR